MHGTIKSNHNYTHIWVQIIPNVKVTHFLNQRYIHEFDFFFFFLEYTWVCLLLLLSFNGLFILDSSSFTQY